MALSVSDVSSALLRISKLLVEEVQFLRGVKDQVEDLQEELQWMQSFLQEADTGKVAANAVVRNGVVEIRNLALDAEDVIESYFLHVVSRRKAGFSNAIRRSACFLEEGWLLHQTNSEIEKLTARIKKLTSRFQRYDVKRIREGLGGPSTSSNARWEHSRRPYPHIVDDHIVGLDGDIEKLVSILVDDQTNPCRRVVSICGMGGLGKTTLAKKIYQHRQVTCHFDHLGWAYVSQQCHYRKVWEDLLSDFHLLEKEDREVKNEDLAAKLSKVLKDKKCLVILDDIWSIEAWDSLKAAFSMTDTGSKILLTTRNMDLVCHADPIGGYLFPLKCLKGEETWVLFQKFAFPDKDSSDYRVDYSKKEELGKDMLKGCAGLPLAIIVLAGILARKKQLNQWQMVSENVESYLNKDEGQVSEQVLALSYEDLPPYLKPCFLYFSHFPEDYEIDVDRLIQLWVAEGIVSPYDQQDEEGGEIMEDVAESYLNELVERCLVQVGKRDTTLRIKTCRVHDLMRDLCLSKAKKENFIHIIGHSNSFQSTGKFSPASISPTVRRIVEHEFTPVQLIRSSHLRSILFFYDHFKRNVDQTWTCMFEKFKLLRVLGFEGENGYGGCKLPSTIGNLIHLRFLSLREISFGSYRKLPSSLGNLSCLQTLDLRVGGEIPIYIPNVIWRLKQLRHLYLPRRYNTKSKLELHTLTNLQTLVNFWTKYCLIRDLCSLTSLKKLEMFGPLNFEDLGEKPPMDVDMIIQSKHIRSLSIECDVPSADTGDITSRILSSCISTIWELNLCALTGRLPEHHRFSSNIAYLHLKWCNLVEDPMPTLGKLPNLRTLKMLFASFIGTVMYCRADDFPKLESLVIGELFNLQWWQVERGAMPALRRLEIAFCPRLVMLPEGLMFIRTLHELNIAKMPHSFKSRLERGGPDFFKVKNVPSIIYFLSSPASGLFDINLSVNSIGRLVNKEVPSPLGLKEHMKDLQRELRWMQRFLQDENTRNIANSEVVRNCVAEIRELAYDAEDLIESFLLQVANSKSKGGVGNAIKTSAHCLVKEKDGQLYQTESEVARIIDEIKSLTSKFKRDGVKRTREEEGPSTSSNARWEQSMQPYPHCFLNDHIVGRDEDINRLASILVDDGTNCSRIVSLYGECGMGKTTVAKRVYHHSLVRNHFTHFAFVHVSKHWPSERSFFEDILSGLISPQERGSKLSDEELQARLYNFLKYNRCLLILDDIGDTEAWCLLLHPAESSMTDMSSKLLLTSRREGSIFGIDGGIYEYKLKPLTQEKSWELFQKLAFPYRDYNVDYSKKEELGGDMLKACAGLPMTIVLLARILSRKNLLDEWLMVAENVKSLVNKYEGQVSEQLVPLSYEDLPPHLKPCFLYLSHFPEDYEIPVDRLIQLWVAEGFILSNEGEGYKAEDVAESYLNELAERCLIHVEERDATLRIKTCSMHQQMINLCLSKARQENFLRVIRTSYLFQQTISPRFRRVVAHEFNCVNETEGESKLRSIFFFCNPGNEMDKTWTSLFNNFKMLRVLGFEERDTFGGLNLPSGIGNLIHLRYLSLRDMEFTCPKLPSSLGNLRCLQSLDLRVRGGIPIYIPNVIWKLEELRHLYLPHPNDCNSKTKLKLHTLTKLQTLVNFNTGHCFIKDLCSLKNLRKLEMFFVGLNAKDHFEEDPGKKVLPIIRSLSIQCPNEATADHATNITLLILSSCLSTIWELSLEAKIGKLPDNFSNSNISYLRLRRCQLEEDPMPTLEKLRYLRILKLERGAFVGTKMVCSANHFPILDSLTLAGLENLEEWEVEQGAMPALRSLEIRDCPQLQMLPEGLKFTRALQELKIGGMPDSFKSKLESGNPTHAGIIFLQDDI